MSDQWSELIHIVELNNQGKVSEAIKLACTFELDNKVQLLGAIVSIFELTAEFISRHINEAYKIINSLYGIEFKDIRDAFRGALLIDIFNSISLKKGDL